MKSEYRGEDVILERVKAAREKNGTNLTWEQLCESVAQELEAEGLTTSANHARNIPKPV